MYPDPGVVNTMAQWPDTSWPLESRRVMWLDRIASAFRTKGRVDVDPRCLVHLGPRVLIRNGPTTQRGRPIPVMAKITHRSKSLEVQQ